MLSAFVEDFRPKRTPQSAEACVSGEDRCRGTQGWGRQWAVPFSSPPSHQINGITPEV